MLAIRHDLICSQYARTVFLVDFEQVLQVFFGWKSLFHLFVVVVYYTFLQE